MIGAFEEKSVVTIMGTGVTNAGTGTSVIDRLGWDYVSLDLVLGTANVVSNIPTVLKIAESDITDSTGYANVVAFTGGTATSTSIGFVIPTVSDTTNPNVYRMNIDCRGRKRYLKLSVSPATTQLGFVAARLRRAKETPQSASAAGCALVVSG